MRRRSARASLGKLRGLVPGALVLVYDNYNALAIGLSPTERASDAVVSLALYPRWVSLFFMRGAELDDPRGLLQGGGKIVRHVVLKEAGDLDGPEIRELIGQAVALSDEPFEARGRGRVLIKSISAKQRPRSPA